MEVKIPLRRDLTNKWEPDLEPGFHFNYSSFKNFNYPVLSGSVPTRGPSLLSITLVKTILERSKQQRIIFLLDLVFGP